jgi:hypothetical protein
MEALDFIGGPSGPLVSTIIWLDIGLLALYLIFEHPWRDKE